MRARGVVETAACMGASRVTVKARAGARATRQQKHWPTRWMLGEAGAGNLIVMADDGMRAVGEEQFHGFQNRNGANLSDVVMHLGDLPENRQIRAYFRKDGF